MRHVLRDMATQDNAAASHGAIAVGGQWLQPSVAVVDVCRAASPVVAADEGGSCSVQLHAMRSMYTVAFTTAPESTRLKQHQMHNLG